MGVILTSLINPLYAINPIWNAGGIVGISATFGTKVNRIGFLTGAYIVCENIQLNAYANRLYCFNSYGPDLKRIENQFNLGITGAFGPETLTLSREAVFFSPVSNFTGKSNSLSYVFKIYSDNISTSQNTGIIGFQSGNFHFFTENDLFIFKGSDKYRTGAVSVIYQNMNMQLGVNLLLWTGNNNDEKKIKIKPGESDYRSEFGYYDLSETKYGKFSHGILAFSGAYALPYSQTISAMAGIDSEQIRHVVQNKFLHDMPFIPKKLNKAINPHFPKLDSNGLPYLKKQDQTMKKSKFFGTVSVNPTLFY
ncbi:MAG: hypothetical protein H0V01_13180 [Bacteroidetes bacterium]|nr:hypothetical protein [Bacteroidota bacterium]HET6245021.1 polymorphic toxin type 23 domain-containing protein [Bacteroidia bacterium]